MIAHHPRADALSGYATGVLSPGLALAVACHLELCAACDAKVAAWESVGGALLSAAEPVALAPDALAKAMAAVAKAPRAVPEALAPRFLRPFSLPKPLYGQSIGARYWVSPRIWFAPVRCPARPGTRTYLLYSRGNAVVPEHTHSGAEFTAVLQGSLDEGGETFSGGDFIQRDEHNIHAPRTVTARDCLCLIGSDGPIRFTGLVARLIQILAGNRF